MQNFELSNELFAALIGIGIALVSQVLVNVIHSIDSGKKWKRQQVMESYKECLASTSKIYTDINMLIKFGGNSEATREAHLSQCRTSLERFNHSVGAVDLVASSRFSNELGKFSANMSLCATEITTDANHLWTSERHREVHSPILSRLRDQAQRDLGFRHWWNRRPKAD